MPYNKDMRRTGNDDLRDPKIVELAATIARNIEIAAIPRPNPSLETSYSLAVPLIISWASLSHCT